MPKYRKHGTVNHGCSVFNYKERMKAMKERLSKLLTVKSIVTVALTMVFCVLAVRGVIDSQQFMATFTTVIAFYFGTQAERKSAEKETKGE